MRYLPHHKASEYFERARDQFEQIYRDSEDGARVMAIVVHPYIMGAAHRARYFHETVAMIAARKDVLVWTGAQIADWYLGANPGE